VVDEDQHAAVEFSERILGGACEELECKAGVVAGLVDPQKACV